MTTVKMNTNLLPNFSSTHSTDNSSEIEFPDDDDNDTNDDNNHDHDNDVDVDVPVAEGSDNLLRDVLDELELERAKRIQLEIQFSELPKRRQEESKEHQKEDGDIHNNDEEDTDTFERRNYPLYIAHEINSIFTEGQSIPKRNVYPILSKLFNSLYDSTVIDANGTVKKYKPINAKKKEKRIKDAISRVYAESDNSYHSRIMRTEYNESMLKPILHTVASDFVKSLIEDTTVIQNPPANTKISASTARNGEQIDQIDGTKTRGSQFLIKQLSTERDGYLDLINALTSDNVAVTLSSQNSPGVLPLHIVRFLEIMPWDDRAQDYLSAEEEVHQWQAWDLKTKSWSDKKIRLVPLFSSLPISKMEKCASYEESETQSSGFVPSSPVKKIQHAFDAYVLSGRVLTNASVSHVLDLAHGYPLPESGIWEWIGNWSLKDTVSSAGGGSNIVDDEEGWTYSDQLESLISGDHGRMENDATPTSRFRKRVWYRRRVLVAYPGISQGTRQMLNMNAHNAKLTFAVSKLHDQVHGMQNKLIQKDEELDKTTMGLMSQIASADADLYEKQREIDQLRIRLDESSKKAGKSSTPAVHVDILRTPLISFDDITGEDEGIDHAPMKDEKEEATEQGGEASDNATIDSNDLTEVGTTTAGDKDEKDQQKRADFPKLTDSIGWKISPELLLETVRSNVQTVRSNVQSNVQTVRSNVQSNVQTARSNAYIISEKARKLQAAQTISEKARTNKW